MMVASHRTISFLLMKMWVCGSGFVESFRMPRPNIAAHSSRCCLHLRNNHYQSHQPLRSMIDPDGSTVSTNSLMMDPLLLETMSFLNLTTTTSFLTVARGLSVWRRALLKGHVPFLEDFASVANTSDATAVPLLWPAPKVLFDAIVNHMIQYQIPRLVHRHPVLIRTILLCLLRLVNRYMQQMETASAIPDDDCEKKEQETVEESITSNPSNGLEQTTSQDEPMESQPQKTLDEQAQIAAKVVADEFQGMMPAISGMQALDSVFGSATTNALVMESHSGIGDQNSSLWQHSGWTLIPELQNQISRLPALRRLIDSLGRRSTAAQSDGRYHKFLRRPVDDSNTASLHAQMDPRLARDTVSGLTRSNRYSDMLPSEAVGLLKTGSAAHVLRRLFYAKLVESQLLSYEVSGWADVSSRLPPNKSPRYRRTPSARGGPILICLDTSFSMTIRDREWISKAVVLACVRAAHQQQRSCRLIAFGEKGTFMDAGDALIRPDADGLRHLLDFLSHSFGGGTDVTGALKHAMKLLGKASTENAPNEMSAADWLLITDGEISHVSENVLQQVRQLQEESGLQVHGVLVGHSKEEGKSMQALEEICTHTHDFLLDFPGQSYLESPKSTSNRVTSSALYMTPPKLFRNGPTWSQNSFIQTSRFGRRWNFVSSNRRRRAMTESGELPGDASNEKQIQSTARERDNTYSLASRTIHTQAWDASSLCDEQNSKGSCYRFREQFQEAVNRVGENLIEREIESRLVVLGMISGEHVLFLGPPGTAKSALGRSLSLICGGTLFQRLLTRFTTPEEIFGPLSLRALENDEYKRCTEGFLPTATVAFLDEIFKANSAILNTLLTILNERQFDNGAGRREDCPIRCVIAASNELPESEELDALYDRFLLRKDVLPVSDDGIMELLTTSSTIGVASCDDAMRKNGDGKCDAAFADSLDGIVEELSVAADAVQMDAEIAFLLRDLRVFLRDEMNINLSDRRLLKAARLLKVVAASHGRARVDPIDCLLLQHVAWSVPEQRETIRKWLWDHATPGAMNHSLYHMLLICQRSTAMKIVNAFNGDVTESMSLRSLRSEVSQLIGVLQLQLDALSRHMELLRQSAYHLWLGSDEARMSQQSLLPLAQTAWYETRRVLIHAHQLEFTLLPSSDAKVPLSNDIRLSVMKQLWDDSKEMESNPKLDFRKLRSLDQLMSYR